MGKESVGCKFGEFNYICFSLQKACEKVYCKSLDSYLSNPERKLEKVLQDQEIQAIGFTTKEDESHEESLEQEGGFVGHLETAQEVDTFCSKKICCKGIKWNQ